MKKYNKSAIMKRAWELVKKLAVTMSEALKQSWKEAKNMCKDLAKTIESNLESVLYNNKYITAGTNRKITINDWEKGDKKRTYFNIRCYTSNWKYKRTYNCGYIDNVTGEYVTDRYTDFNALTLEYVG